MNDVPRTPSDPGRRLVTGDFDPGSPSPRTAPRGTGSDQAARRLHHRLGLERADQHGADEEPQPDQGLSRGGYDLPRRSAPIDRAAQEQPSSHRTRPDDLVPRPLEEGRGPRAI